MNILVVDDEFYIVQGITQNVDWNKLGVTKVFIAYSMKQAQEILINNEIDILLTDIEMPKGSGLELISWANSNSLFPVKLILTGHQNFNYAQEAIHLQCFQYVLKPVITSKLEEELKRAIEKVNENKHLNRAKNIADSWDSNKTLQYETFWNELFYKMNNPNEENIIEAMNRLSVPRTWLNSDFYLVLFHFHPKMITSDRDFKLSTTEINQIIMDELCVPADIFILRISSSSMILPIQSDHFIDYQNALEFCESLLSRLSEVLSEYRITIYLSDKTPIFLASDCYQTLKKFESNIFTTDNIVIPVNAVTTTMSHEFSDSLTKNIPLSEWLDLLTQYKSDLIIEDIKTLFKKDSYYYSIKMLITLYYGVLQTVFSVLDSNNITLKELFPKLLHHTDFVKATSSIEEFLYWSNQLLKETEDILKVNANTDNFLESIKKFIKANLGSEALNRNYIAEAIHINPDYLSYLFHKQSGMLLNTYITNERINAAKNLLLTTDMTLQEIADTTGFSNSSYFHKQFKKISGLTPQQYRQVRNQ